MRRMTGDETMRCINLCPYVDKKIIDKIYYSIPNMLRYEQILFSICIIIICSMMDYTYVLHVT